jgi:hypothetical protein
MIEHAHMPEPLGDRHHLARRTSDPSLRTTRIKHS